MKPTVVLDTNVLVAGLRSRRGASFRILSLIGQGAFTHVVSVALVLEYEAILKDRRAGSGLSARAADDVVDYLCATGLHQSIHYLWRPQLPDPKDDLVLEVAAEAGCDAIVTFNARDFAGAERFGVAIESPGEFLNRVEKKK